MKLYVLWITLLAAVAGLVQDKVPAGPYEKSVQWVDIHVPEFPPLAQVARIRGTVTIEMRFKGCEFDRESPRIVSGHPMLATAALEGLKQSTLRCGDFPDSRATVDYEFDDYIRPGCEGAYPRVEVAGSRVRILGAMPCIQR